MAASNDKTAAGNKPAGTQDKQTQQDMVASGQLSGADVERDVTVRGRLEATAPAPQHGDPTELQRPGLGETVLGVRVGSEAAVEDGIDPVLPAGGAPLGEATRVRNRTLQARDEREFRRRGLRTRDGAIIPGRTISITFEGPMIIEREAVEGEVAEGNSVKTMVSGSYTGVVPQSGLMVRPLTPEEEAEMLTPAGQRAQGRRANDLVAGSGAGGGGNPMHAGDARGVTSATDRQVGSGGVTSAAGGSPQSRPAAGGVTPQGGGSTSRS